MIFIDGECPICRDTILHLNTLDLFECPKCALMLSMADRVIAAILPEKGDGEFRFENCITYPMEGILIAKAKESSVLPDLEKGIFKNRDSLIKYLDDIPKKNHTEDESFDLWYKFKNSFSDLLSCESQENINTFWNSKTERTSYYQKILMPKISDDIGLIHGNEEFKVDYVMSKRTSYDYSVPRIFIESENDFKSSDHEIRKLCSLNSPLRVLTTVYDNWNPKNIDETVVYDSLVTWQQIIIDHYKLNSFGFNGTIAIIIGSKVNNSIRFRSCVFWSNGVVRQPIDEFCIVNH